MIALDTNISESVIGINVLIMNLERMLRLFLSILFFRL